MEKEVILHLEGVSKQFPSQKMAAVEQVSLSIIKGELVGLLGPSGCGKTTLLRMIAGFEQPSEGSIKLAGEIVSSSNCFIPPEKRNTGMVFQDYALFPHLNIADNIAFGLRTKNLGLNNRQIKEKVAYTLDLVGLSGLEKRYPHQLSGGQQQRVALARALAPQPALILLDEPLSNLDVQIREKLRHEMRNILKASGSSAIFVTHDQEEALAISDKIGVMSQGRLYQLGTPEEIYTQPASKFVAEFVTGANFLPARKEADCWTTEIGQLYLSNDYTCNTGDVMLRQEDILLIPDDESSIVVQERQFLGREYRYCLQTPLGSRLHALTDIGTILQVGTKVKVAVAPEAIKLFPDSSKF